MKHLKLFQTEAEYTAYTNSGDFITPNVSYTVDSTKIFYNPHIEISGHNVGDICLSNANGDKKFIKVGAAIPDGWTPIGIVVIPSSHDVYGTGECAVMSLKYMSFETPNEGSLSENTMRWGGLYETPIYNYKSAATIGSITAQTETVSFKEGPKIPSDSFTGPTCIKDTNAYYISEYGSAAPSPYLTDGSRNPQYYTTGYNVLSDFNGMGNTNILTGLATAQSDWKTATNITDAYESGYYPPACCCWRYKPTGTNQGDWYLPAMGELGYLCARFKTINNAIQYLIDSGFSDSCGLVDGNLWSSSEYTSEKAHYLRMEYGSVANYSKFADHAVRAFLRVK